MLNETIEWVNEADIPSEARSGTRIAGIPSLPPPDNTQRQLEPLSIPAHSVDAAITSPPNARKGSADAVAHAAGAQPTVDHTTVLSPTLMTSDEGSRLRQRLKAVVSGVGH